MQVPLLDLQAQYSLIKTDVESAVAEVLQSQRFILGPKVDECEEAITRYCGCPHAIGMSSGGDALLACLMAENIGHGDEVITTPYTFFATVGAIARVGATPVFIDIDPQTYNLDANEIESKITKQTRAIIPVHLYGQMADMDVVMSVARKYGLIIIEDAAQAIGAQYKGRSAGSIGHYGCFCFFPSKNLGAAGDGGMVATQDSDRADKLKCLRSHGSKPKYHHKIIGGNFRLDALQAAIVTVKLKYLDQWTAARQRNAKNYSQLLSDALVPLSQQRFAPVTIPPVKTDHHIFQSICDSNFASQSITGLAKAKKDRNRNLLSGSHASSRVFFLLRPMRSARFPRANALRMKPWHFRFTRNSQPTKSIMLWILFGILPAQIPSHAASGSTRLELCKTTV